MPFSPILDVTLGNLAKIALRPMTTKSQNCLCMNIFTNKPNRTWYRQVARLRTKR
jgi:hypothetical protein